MYEREERRRVVVRRIYEWRVINIYCCIYRWLVSSFVVQTWGMRGSLRLWVAGAIVVLGVHFISSTFTAAITSYHSKVCRYLRSCPAWPQRPRPLANTELLLPRSKLIIFTYFHISQCMFSGSALLWVWEPHSKSYLNNNYGTTLCRLVED